MFNYYLHRVFTPMFYGTGKYSVHLSKKNVNTKTVTNVTSTMMYCQQHMQEQWWHKACGNKQPVTDCTKDPLHETEF